LWILIICYLPSILFEETLSHFILGDHEKLDTEESRRAFKVKAIGVNIANILVLTNCSFNFLIYCLCNKRFFSSSKKQVLKFKLLLMSCYLCRKINFQAESVNSSSSFENSISFQHRNSLYYYNNNSRRQSLAKIPDRPIKK
jgi:tRNA pseudouridine-54 N-methylase